MKIIVNHKANLSYKDILNYEKKIRKLDLIICPSLCYLSVFQKGKYTLGSQDISRFDEFNKTGEINSTQLKSLNVKYVLIGHYDRRIYNKEDKIIIKEKLEKCIKNNMIPIYCVGHENLENTKIELDDILNYTKDKEIVIALEPKDNIGSENIDIIKLVDDIKEIQKFLSTRSNNIKLVYGGGVSIDIVNNLKNIDGLYGILISKESLDYNNIIKIYKEIMF